MKLFQINDGDSITQIRNHILKIISNNDNQTGSKNQIIVPWYRNSQTRWTELQLLTEHENPCSVLYLGATIGNDIIGAVKRGLRVCVMDYDTSVLDTISRISQNIRTRNSSHGLDNNFELFDIVIITPWWISDAKKMGKDFIMIIDEACQHLNEGGHLLIHFLGNKLISELFHKLYSGEQQKKYKHRISSTLSIKKTRNYLKKLGFNSQYFLILRNPIEPRDLLADNAVDFLLSDLFFGSPSQSLKNSFRKLLLRLFINLNLPKSWIFPWVIIRANKTTNKKFPIYIPKFIKTGNLTTSSIGEYQKQTKFVRHDPGNGEVLNEERILSYLSSFNQISNNINPPEEHININGVESVIYKYIPGREVKYVAIHNYYDEILNFLINLSSIEAPIFLPSGFEFILNSIISSQNYHLENKYFYLFQRGISALNRLNEKNIFKWIVHGDLKSNNIRLSKDGKNLIVVDWIFSHKGHPLMDFWSYELYFSKNLPKKYPTPKELILNLDQKSLDDLWFVWQAYRVKKEK